MAVVSNWIPALQTTVVNGADAGRDPVLLDPNSFHKGRNVSVRGARAKSRPRYVKRVALPSGKIQGATAFSPDGGVLIVSVDGRIYEIDPNKWTQVQLTSDTDRGNPGRPRHYYCETVGSLVIQDFQTAPGIYDGADLRRAKRDEVPIGGPMAYSNGRLSVVVNRGKDVRIGDVRKTDHQSELKFTEAFNLLGGGDFAYPEDVLALGVLPVIDTGSGQGPLIVGCERQISSLKTQITQRSLWSEVGLGSQVFPKTGIVGQTAWAAVNQDLFFRSRDGIRSLRSSVTDYDSLGLTPISREVGYRVDYDADFLLRDCSMVYFDNRLICTHSPMVYGNRSIFQGVVSLNFDGIGGIGGKTPPAYDGEWDTGFLIAEIVVGIFRGEERCFFVGRDVDGTNGVWEQIREKDDPVGVTETPTHAVSTRGLVFDAPSTIKALKRADLWFSKIEGDLDVEVYFKPDQYPYWVKWDSFEIRTNVPAGQSRKSHYYRSRVSATTPTDEIEGTNQQPLGMASSFQVKVEWVGQAVLDQIQVFAAQVPESGLSDNSENNSESTLEEVPSFAVEESFWYQHENSPYP